MINWKSDDKVKISDGDPSKWQWYLPDDQALPYSLPSSLMKIHDEKLLKWLFKTKWNEINDDDGRRNEVMTWMNK